MPLDGLTSGIDHKVSFIDSSGVLQFATIESFTSKEDATTDKKISMDGVVRHPKFHQGWSGSFSLQRSSNFMDSYIAQQEARYNLGLDQIPVTITETITEENGSLSQYQYTRAVLTLEDAGNYSGTEIAVQKVGFVAARKLRVA